MNATLDAEEYVEQSYFFHSLLERIEESCPMQDIMSSVREELLITTKLPMAIDFMLAELKHSGQLHPAMINMPHYFTPFQTFVVASAEDDRGRFDFRIALEILSQEAKLRSKFCSPQAFFLYQFETLCRHRLEYDAGLTAMAGDPSYDETWRAFIELFRRQLGIIEFGDMIYLRSEYYLEVQQKQKKQAANPDFPPIFGNREGRIALANRKKDPLLLFSALQRQLDYPKIPRPKPVSENKVLLPQLIRRMERLEMRLKIAEEEQRGGFDLSKFYEKNKPPSTE
ncbi:MAG: hypothetical protein ACKVH8_02045 [Pirellulales bacterium]